jgi:hypothetical protein
MDAVENGLRLLTVDGDLGAIFQEVGEPLQNLGPFCRGDRLVGFDVDVHEPRQVEWADDELFSHFERLDVQEDVHRAAVLAVQGSAIEVGVERILPVEQDGLSRRQVSEVVDRDAVVIDDEADIGRRVAIVGQRGLEDELLGGGRQGVVELQENDVFGARIRERFAADLVAFDAFASGELVDGAFQRAAVGVDRKTGVCGNRGRQTRRG